MKDPICVDFQEIGVNEIYTDTVVRKWNHLWGLYEWRVGPAQKKLQPDAQDSWRLIKGIRIDSPNVGLKLTISEAQAKELIKQLDLQPIQSAFRSGWTWKREQDWVKIYNYKKKGE